VQGVQETNKKIGSFFRRMGVDNKFVCFMGQPSFFISECQCFVFNLKNGKIWYCNRPGSYFYFFAPAIGGLRLIYIPGRIQGDLVSRRYVVGGLGNLFWMNNTVAILLYGYYLVITRTYTILGNTHVLKLQYFVQR
jgi:hypothetical protein